MNTVQTRLFSVFILAFFLGCSTASVRVMPNADGSVRAVARDTTKDGAEEAAAKKARKYCEAHDQEAVYLQDDSKYTGSMDEGTRENIRKASDVAWMLGGMNSPVADAGTAGHVWTSGKDYEASVLFRCR